MSGRRSRLEFAFAGLIFFIVSIAAIHLKLVRVDQQYGDMAQLSEIIDNIRTRGWPADEIMPSVLAYVSNHIATVPADQLASSPLSPPAVSEQSVFGVHMYLILYPLAALSAVVPTELLLLSAYVLTFTGAIGMAYLRLRRSGMSIAAAAAFCLLLTLHPAWSQGMRGQFQVDTLFVSAGFLFVLLVSGPRRRLPLVGAALLCASIDERAAAVAGIVLVAYAVLYWTKPDVDRWFKISLGILLLGYTVVVVKFALTLVENTADFLPTNTYVLMSRLADAQFVHGALLFLLVNGVLWVFALFEWRAALIALLLMLPNVFGNIGGAEKIGWSTHYHDDYLPVLFWAATAGVARAWNAWSTLRGRMVLFALVGASAAFFAFIDPATGTFAWSNVSNAFELWLPREAAAYGGSAGSERRGWLVELGRSIPPHTVVSTVEAAMPWVYRGRTLLIFPFGVDQADYAVVIRLAGNGAQAIYGGVDTNLGAAEAAKINAVMKARMLRDGYDLVHPVYVAPNGLTVLRRGH